MFVEEIVKLLLDSANAKRVNLFEKKKSICCKNLDMNKVKIQLQMLPDTVKATPLYKIPIKQVTYVQTLCKVFNNQPKIILTEVHKLLRIYLTIPVTTSTAE